MNRERACIDFKPTKKWVMLTVGDSPMIVVQGPLERGDGGGHVPYLHLSQLLLRAEKRICLSGRFSGWA